MSLDDRSVFVSKRKVQTKTARSHSWAAFFHTQFSESVGSK
jgi:hypothetical protein